MVNPWCVYANDVMVEGARQRFLEGRSCREITSEMGSGLSEAHLCRLTNLALKLVSEIHAQRREEIARHLGKWILQIDGTVDGDFESVVAVRDARSGFLLYGRKCHSESERELTPLLEEIKSRFGVPAATLSDLHSIVLATLEHVFPGTPRALCGFHFLRDLGRDLMMERHVALARMLRTAGTRAALKRALVDLPPITTSVALEVEHGYSAHSQELCLMSARRMLERLLSEKRSNGYGFPFALQHLEFLHRCLEVRKKLAWIHQRTNDPHVADAVKAIDCLKDDAVLRAVAQELEEIARLFQSLRDAMRLYGERTPLSAEHRRGKEAQEACRKLMEEFERYLESDIPPHLYRAAKHIWEDYRKREGQLFVEVAGVDIPFTNNGLEQQFRRVRRAVRKRCGDMATGRQLTLHGEELVLFQNMGNPEYRKVVFGEGDTAAKMGAERRRLPRVENPTSRKITRLLEKGLEMMIAGQLPEHPYSVAARGQGAPDLALGGIRGPNL